MRKIVCLLSVFVALAHGYPYRHTDTTYGLQRGSQKRHVQNSYFFLPLWNPFRSFKCVRPGYHPEPHDCRLFYECTIYGHGRFRLFSHKCDRGFVFSTAFGGMCTYPHESGRPECGGTENVTWSPFVEDKLSTKVTIGPDHKTTESFAHEVKDDTHNTYSHGSPFPAECSSEGFLSHPTNCKKYYKCLSRVNGTYKLFEMTCKGGTIWDQDMQSCRYPWKVRDKNNRCSKGSADSDENFDLYPNHHLSQVTQSPDSSNKRTDTNQNESSIIFPDDNPSEVTEPTNSRTTEIQKSNSQTNEDSESLESSNSQNSSWESEEIEESESGEKDKMVEGDSTTEDLPKSTTQRVTLTTVESTTVTADSSTEKSITQTVTPATQKIFTESITPTTKETVRSSANPVTLTTEKSVTDTFESSSVKTVTEATTISTEESSVNTVTFTPKESVTTSVQPSTKKIVTRTVPHQPFTQPDTLSTTETVTITKEPNEEPFTEKAVSTTPASSLNPVSITTEGSVTTTEKSSSVKPVTQTAFPTTQESSEHPLTPSITEKFTATMEPITGETVTNVHTSTTRGQSTHPVTLSTEQTAPVTVVPTTEKSVTDIVVSTTDKSSENPVFTTTEGSVTITKESSSVKPVTQTTFPTTQESSKHPVTPSTTEKVTATMEPITGETVTNVHTSTTRGQSTHPVTLSTEQTAPVTVVPTTEKSVTDIVVSTTDNSSENPVFTTTEGSVTITKESSSVKPITQTAFPRTQESSEHPVTPSTTEKFTATMEPITGETVTNVHTSTTRGSSTHPVTLSTEQTAPVTVVPTTEKSVTDIVVSTTDKSSENPVFTTTEGSVTATKESSSVKPVTQTDFPTTHEPPTDSVTLSTEGSGSTTVEPSTEHTPTITLPPVTSEPPVDITKCRAPGFYSDPNDCTKFYRCIQIGYFNVFVKYDFVCPERTVWDQDLLTCNHPWAVKHFICKKNPTMKPQIDDNSVNMNADNSCPIGKLTGDQIALICPTGFRRHPKYCNIFYQCTSESNLGVNVVLFKCPKGLIYNEDRMQCIPDYLNRYFYKFSGCKNILVNPLDNSVPILNVSSKPLCSNEGSYPYHPSCSNAYFKCKRDTRGLLQGYLLKCPREHVFSTFSRRCEPAKYFPLCSNPDSFYKKDSSSNGLYITHEIFYIGRQLS